MEIVRNTWYAYCWSADVTPGALLARTIAGDPIVVGRAGNGTPFALYDRCPHRFAPLSRGRVSDDRVVCGYHGLVFDLDGRCVHNPHGNHVIPPAATTRAFPLVERHSMLWIWLGDQTPRPDDVPDFAILDRARPEFVSKRDYIVMQAGYDIITDNLLDLSHVNVLHDGLLGNAEANVADIDVVVDGETVTVSRFSADVPVPAVFDLAFRQDGRNVDTWTEMRWDVPACMQLEAGVTEPGAAKAAGTAVVGIHLLTPETALTTHYHFAAVRINPPQRSPEEEVRIRDEVSRYRRMIFETQDAPMIAEQQQRILAARDAPRPALLSIDAAPVRARKILDARIARERSVTLELTHA